MSYLVLFGSIGQSYIIYAPTFGIILTILCILFGLIVLFANSLTIHVVITSKRLQSVPNMFLVSLSFADLVIALPLITFNLLPFVKNEIAAKIFYCVIMSLTFVSSLMSLLTLFEIAIDRYIAISMALKYKTIMTPSRAKKIIIIS